jgi:hypothetical protein
LKIRLISGAAPRASDQAIRPSWLTELCGLTESYLDDTKPDLVIVGDASGVDKEARVWCKLNGVAILIGEAHWTANGKSAGPRRNRAMVQTAAAFAMSTVNDVRAAAFPGPQSRGTWDAVRLCEEFRVPVDVLGPWAERKK